jgi:inosose dehydratase
MSARSAFTCCQVYPWLQRHAEKKQNWREHLDDILAVCARAGFEGWDQLYPDEAEAKAVKALLDRHGLVARSQYIGGIWHEPDSASKVFENAKREAAAGRSIGVELIVCNPRPLAPDGRPDKSDDELKRQCDLFGRFGDWLATMGMKLAYHTHDAEMRQGAREFHHMLLNTDPAKVGFCLDAHWVYRGCGNSQVALDDIIRAYGHRIAAVHLRQSHGSVWAETLEEGDIDHSRLAAKLKEIGFAGPLIAECALEGGTPRGLSDLEREQRARKWIRDTFGV